MDLKTAMLVPFNELPDDMRVPLHSLQADLDMLLTRHLREDGEVRGMIRNAIRSYLSQIETAAYRLANSSISLRDQFAGQALTGLIAQSVGSATQSPPDYGAKWSYEMADAMLKAREVSK